MESNLPAKDGGPMTDILMRKWQPDDEADILRLNAESVSVLSPMDSARFSELRDMCRLLSVAEKSGQAVGFLMGFCDGAGYDSPNYRWFAARLKRFLYIDRVVVSRQMRGLGLGRLFYNEAQRWAVEHQLAWLAAEVDLQPPNTASLAFHQQLKFVEVGRQKLDGGKMVSLQVRPAGA